MSSTAVRTALLSILLASLGCASPVRVERSDGVDLGRYATWSWLADSPRTIHAPTPYLTGLDRELARFVAQELSRRGFRQVARGGELRVGAALAVQREHERSLETGAMQLLSTYSSDGAYEIQRSVLRTKTFSRSRLAVYVLRPGHEEIAWRGVLERRFEGEFAPHMGTVVRELLAIFPSSAPPPRDPGSGPGSEFSAAPREEPGA